MDGLDLEQMLADHMDWAAKTLKKRNRFHQCCFVLAPRSAISEMARFPNATTLKMHDAPNPRPEDVAVMYVLAEFTPEATLNRLKDLSTIKGNTRQLEALAAMESMARQLGLKGEAVFRVIGNAIASYHRYTGVDAGENFAKDIFMEHMREMTRITRAFAVIMVMEAYFREGMSPDAADRPKSLKNDPQSREALWGVLVTPNSPARGAMMKVHRKKPHTGKVLHIGKMDRADGSVGRFTEFFAENATVTA